METSPTKDKYIREYVLGTHDPEYEQQFEEHLLTDERLLEQLSIIEDELVNDYLSGKLSESEKENFENRFLKTSAGKRELRFFGALKNHVDKLSSSEQRTPLPRSWKRFRPAFRRNENPWLRVSFATVLLILIFAALFVVLRNRSSEPSAVFTATLAPGQVKTIGGRPMNVVDVPPGTGVINLQMTIGEQIAESYQASVLTDQGEEKFSRDDLHAESGATDKFVSVSVPAKILTSGDYRLRLRRRVPGDNYEDVASYSFRVIRR
jgi:hypothetical protein